MNKPDFKSMFLGEWGMDSAVYSREEVDRMLRRGEISEDRAQEMLRMRYRAANDQPRPHKLDRAT